DYEDEPIEKKSKLPLTIIFSIVVLGAVVFILHKKEIINIKDIKEKSKEKIGEIADKESNSNSFDDFDEDDFNENDFSENEENSFDDVDEDIGDSKEEIDKEVDKKIVVDDDQFYDFFGFEDDFDKETSENDKDESDDL